MLVFGVLVVWQGGAERIVEDSYGFIEGDAMLGKIAGGFGRIELEVEAGECHTLVVCDILARCTHLRIEGWGTHPTIFLCWAGWRG